MGVDTWMNEWMKEGTNEWTKYRMNMLAVSDNTKDDILFHSLLSWRQNTEWGEVWLIARTRQIPLVTSSPLRRSANSAARVSSVSVPLGWAASSTGGGGGPGGGGGGAPAPAGHGDDLAQTDTEHDESHSHPYTQTTHRPHTGTSALLVTDQQVYQCRRIWSLRPTVSAYIGESKNSTALRLMPSCWVGDGQQQQLTIFKLD